MLAEYKTIIDDLLDYLITGKQDGLTVGGFNGLSFDSTAINGIKYQFIKKYEHVNTITDSTVIPILVITQPEQYLKGRVLYNGKFNDLKTILLKEEDAAGKPIKKINFYIIPQITGIQGNNLGSITFDLKIDYVSDYDTYGFMSKEIDSILKRHYFKQHRGDYYWIPSPSRGNLFFVPTVGRNINQESILNRIAQTFNIRFCAVV